MEIYENLSIESLPNEEWRDVVGYEGLYQVSSLGRVCNTKSKRVLRHKITNRKDGGSGYHIVNLYINKKKVSASVHRLVAKAFIPNPENKPQIDHINCKRGDNAVENLRWATAKENSNNPLTLEKKQRERNPFWGRKHTEEAKQIMSQTHKGKKLSKEQIENLKEVNSYIVLQYDKSMNLLGTFRGTREAAKATGVNHCNISMACTGYRKTAGGFIWKYKKDYE